MSKDTQTTVSPTAEQIQQWLVGNIADRLDISPDEINIDDPITDLGLSSRETIMLSGELEDWLGRRLSPELLYEYPQIKQLSEMLAGGGSPAPVSESPKDEMGYRSVVDLFISRAEELQDKTAFTHLIRGELDDQHAISYFELVKKAKAIAAHLQKLNLEGERILILLPSGINFICSFAGALFAKAIAVPAFPPQKTRGAERIEAIFKDAQASYAFADNDLLEKIRSNKKLEDNFIANSVHWINVDEISVDLADQWTEPEIGQQDLAFLQYTSGSTGNPKGVMVSHGNILHNCKTIRLSFGLNENMSTVSWLPMFHDMGLIGCILTPVNMKGHTAFMAPVDFLDKPIRWLQAITRFKSDFSTAPNFAYELLTDKVTEEELQTLDLSTWVGAGNGSEPVIPETLRRFSKHFAPCGFQHKNHYPCYGMAETTLMIAGIDPQTEAKVLNLDEQELKRNNIKIDKTATSSVSKISCGYNRQGVLKIVDPETFQALPENQVGEIWYQSDSVALGYWNKPELTKETFQATIEGSNEGHFLRTGDLGFIHDGELYITGRVKDLVIIRGRNHYPQDIEKTVQESHPALSVNGGAAFSVDIEGAERLVIVQEVERTALKTLEPEAIFESIRATVAEEHEVAIHAITLLSPGRLPRTTSGKIQRNAAKKDFLEGTLHQVAEWKMTSEDTEQPDLGSLTAPSILELKTMDEATLKATLKNYLVELIARIIRFPSDKINTQKPVINWGIDSIHAVQIKGKLETDFHIDIELTELLGDYTIDALATKIAAHIVRIDSNGASGIFQIYEETPIASQALDFDNLTAEQARELLTDIDDLSEDEIEKLLNKLSD